MAEMNTAIEKEELEQDFDSDAEWDSVEWTETDDSDSEGDSDESDSHHEEGKPAADDQSKTEDEPSEDSNHEFELKFNHESVKVGVDEVKRLAQKGLNYDKIVEERDAMKGSMERYRDMEKFLDELKGDFGSIEELMDDTRAKMLMQSDASLSESAALERAKSQRSAKSAPAKQKEVSSTAVDDFIRQYPDVKAEDIPDSVWADVRETGDLVGAYSRYEIKRLKEENEILKQNHENESRSAGSRKTSGGSGAKTLVEQLWDNGD